MFEYNLHNLIIQASTIWRRRSWPAWDPIPSATLQQEQRDSFWLQGSLSEQMPNSSRHRTSQIPSLPSSIDRNRWSSSFQTEQSCLGKKLLWRRRWEENWAWGALSPTLLIVRVEVRKNWSQCSTKTARYGSRKHSLTGEHSKLHSRDIDGSEVADPISLW